MYLLDTSALSQAAPGRQPHGRQAADWVRANADACRLSVVTIMELVYGVEWLARRGQHDRSTRLRAWLDTVEQTFGARIIAVDRAVADLAGRMMATGRAEGYAVDTADLLIAATARVHDLTVVTGNLRHFQQLHVPCLDPAAP